MYSRKRIASKKPCKLQTKNVDRVTDFRNVLEALRFQIVYWGPIKKAFVVHPTEASDKGLTHRKYEDLKMYVQGVYCVAMGEIGLDHVRVRPDKGRDHQAEVFPVFVDWRKRSVSL